MKIDENTKIIGRFHTHPSPRGLNIYNPFFEEARLNAVYLLFYNPDSKPLIDGMRKLNLAGAITAGFESDPTLPKLLDEVDDVATYVGKVGFVTNVNGKLKGFNQSGQGLLRSIKNVTFLKRKNIVIVGAGNVVKSFLFNLSKEKNKPKKVTIFNRTLKKAEKLASDFKIVNSAFPLNKIGNVNGDILVNISDIGGSESDEVYNEEVVRRFRTISDVTFEKEETNLIQLAKKMGKKYSTGWDMFTYQGQVILETILRRKVSAELLKKYVIKGLSQVVK